MQDYNLLSVFQKKLILFLVVIFFTYPQITYAQKDWPAAQDWCLQFSTQFKQGMTWYDIDECVWAKVNNDQKGVKRLKSIMENLTLADRYWLELLATFRTKNFSKYSETIERAKSWCSEIYPSNPPIPNWRLDPKNEDPDQCAQKEAAFFYIMFSKGVSSVYMPDFKTKAEREIEWQKQLLDSIPKILDDIELRKSQRTHKEEELKNKKIIQDLKKRIRNLELEAK